MSYYALTQEMIDVGYAVASSKGIRDERSHRECFEQGLRAALSASPSPVDSRDVRHGIYIASKTKHADRWRFLRDKVGEPIISSWIDEAGEGESDDLADLWRRCIEEASNAEVLILYREKDEILKGAWVELGAALATGAKIFAVGIEEFTIARDARIQHFPDMKAAIAAARRPALSASPEYDAKRYGLVGDRQYKGSFTAYGRYRIAVSYAPNVTETMIAAFQAKFREFWPGSWPAKEDCRSLLEAALAAKGQQP